MSTKQDAKLTLDGNLYDISIDENGDIETEDSFEATILTSLFTDQRADASEMLQPERRRGWIGNHDTEFQLGSKLWLYYQIRDNDESVLQIPSVVFNSLRHLIDDNLASKVLANISVTNGRAELNVEIQRPNNKVEFRHYELWNNTGA